jgi:prepilin-type N-terminal cleavage/methylation domain-containing protein
MMVLTNSLRPGRRAFTLTEVVMATAITAVAFGGIVTCYIQSSRRAEWSGYSLAAHALAIQQLEQARSAKWDTLTTPVVDELTNIAPVTSAVLDLPISGTNAVWVTNYATVSTVTISTTPLVTVHMVKVNTVWPFRGKLFTNSIADYFAPD